jgi:hypothetical protein
MHRHGERILTVVEVPTHDCSHVLRQWDAFW